NSLGNIGTEMGQIGGVTGDCWVNVGFEEDPIFGERIKYTILPSEYVFPIFRYNTSRVYDALLIQWPDQQVIENLWGAVRTRVVLRGEYWTKEFMQPLEDGQPSGPQLRNVLGEIPWVHIPNV